MSNYGEILDQETPPPKGQPASPYGALLDDEVAQQRTRVRSAIEGALKGNPDQAAERQRLTKTSGLPPQTVERNLEEVRIKEQARAIDLLRIAQDSPVLARQLMDPTFTTTSVDDLDTLSSLEKSVGHAVRYMMGAAPGGGITGDLKASISNSAAAVAGTKRAAVDVIEPWARLVAGDDNWFANMSRYYGEQAKGFTEQSKALQSPSDGVFGRGVSSGVQSFGQNAKYLPLAFAGPGGGALALGGMVMESFGASYNKAADKNLPLWTSLGYASADAMVEYWTEKIPLDALIGGIKQGAPLIQQLGKQMALEIPGEQLATVLQDLNEWAVINPGKPFKDYLSERPNAAVETLIATVVGTGGNVAVSSGIGNALDAVAGSNWRQQVSDQYQAMLDEQLKLAGGSMLRERSPEQFRAHIQQVVDSNEGASQEVFVDGEVLNQLPVEVLNQLPESVRAQIAEAAATGDVVSIPMADVLTIAPGTALEQVLNEHAKLDPFALSKAEAAEVGDQTEVLKQEAARVIQQSSDQASAQAEYDQIHALYAGQLNETTRFRRTVNDAKAHWIASFYTTQAARNGMTPTEFQAKYPLRVLGAPSATAAGPVMDQGKPGEVSVEGYHFSAADRPTLTTGAFGTGLRGSARDEIMSHPDQRLKQRLSFYVDLGQGITPESGVGGRAHRAQLTNVYDSDVDPLKLRSNDARAFEAKVLDAGYSGYLSRMGGASQGQVVMLGEQAIQPELLGAQSRITNGQRPPALPRVAPQWQTQASGTPEQLQARLEKMQANPAWADYDLRIEGGQLQSRKKGAASMEEVFNQTPAALPAWSTMKVKGARITAAIKKAAISLAPKASLSRRNYDKLDAIFAKVPNPLASEEAWLKFQSLLVGDGTVLGVPYEALKYAQSPAAVSRYLSRLRPDQLASRRAGFELGARIREQYAAGQAPALITGRLLLWAMLSRKAGAYPHEAAYMDLVNGGVDEWIQKAIDGNWTEADSAGYVAWSSDFMASKKGGASPSAGVTSNANDYGRILLTKMSEKDADGRTQLTRLHDLIADQNVSTDQVRREFFALGDSLGIQNKVLSFALLVTGRWDTLVLDRVQFTHLWGDTYRERAGQRNIYDLGLAAAGEGHFGLAVYEAISRGMSDSLRQGYADAGLTGEGDGTLGAFHWDSWLIESSQAIGHPTIESLMTDRPRPDLAVRQGKFDTFAYNFEYRADGQYQIPLLDGSGYRIISPAEASAFQSRLRDDGEGVVPKDFGVSKNKSAPWVDAPGVDRARYDAILNEYGRRADAADVAPAGLADAGGSVQVGAAGDAAAPADAGNPAPGDLTDGQQTGDRGGRDQGGSLAPLEGSPAIVGATGPDARLVAVAEQYARDNGIELRRQAEYVAVDPERATRIAAAYEAMQHAPNDPAVKEAYADLLRQTTAQYLALQQAGYQFWFMDPAGDPYQGNPWNAMRDLRANQSMAVFPTEAGFGSGGQVNIGLADPKGGPNLDPATVLEALRVIGAEVEGSVVFTSDTEPTLVVKVKKALTKEQGDFLSGLADQEAIAQRTDDEKGSLFGPMAEKWGPFNPEFFVTPTGDRADTISNPLLADTGIMWAYGSPDGEMRPVLANDLFRAVHDAFGHGLEGAGFRAQGEENAWQAHARMFTGPALGALTSETRGQNSWLNYGPHGETNQTAKVEDTVFAEQKTGLMPEWTWTEGRAADASETLKQEAPTPRGTFNPKSLELVLNPNANLSTWFHETGHFFLEVLADVASQPNAPAQIVEDFNTFLKWAGVKDAAKWNKMTLEQKRKYHERWAESIEQYVMEGKAPSVELQPLMRRFASWMKSVYRSLQEMLALRPDAEQTPLNDDIRRVMDRLLATDEQIAQAEQVAGMLPDELATGEAAERLNKRSMADLKWAVRARDQVISKLRTEARVIETSIRQVVTDEVDEMPEYLAKVALDKVMAASPEHKAEVAEHKVARKAAETAATEEVRAALLAENPDAKGIVIGQLLMKNKRDIANKVDAAMIKWDAANPRPRRVTEDMTPQMESIAAQYGYSGVDEMLQAIDAAGPRQAMIDGLTEQRMLEEHGDLIDDRAIQEAANEAVHNEARARSLATELRTQGEMINERADTGKTNAKGSKITVNVLMAAARQFGANVVGRTKVRDLRAKAWQHTAAERRAGQRWQAATAGGKTVEAVRAKQDQVLNNAAAKAAIDARAEAKKLLEYLKKFDSEGVRKKLPPEYLDQIDKLLEAMDLRASTSNKELDRRASLKAWVESQHAMGLDPILPERLLENMALTSWKDMTLDDLRELSESIQNIEHLGRLKSKLLKAKDAREFAIIAQEIADSIRENGGKKLPVKLEGDSRLVKFFKGAWADHRKINSLIRQMDGGVDNGPFYRALIRSMNEAGTEENVMIEAATTKLAELYKPIEALKGGISGAAMYIPEIKNTLTRAGRLSIALNWGNPQNRQRVMDGDNWTEEQVNAILARLTPTELQFVNNVWEMIDGYWPLIKEKQRRVSGVVEDKVEAVPFELNGVQMRGGYYPIKYDSDRSIKAQVNEAVERAAEIMRGAVARPTTRRGHTKARVEEVVGRPVKKDLSVITQHVNQVVHDLAWHEWFIDANRLLNDPRIAGAIREHHGPEIARAMKEAADAIAVGDATHQGEIDKLLLLMRSNVTRSIMGASLTTALLQPFGLTQSMARVGVVPVLKGAGRWAGEAVRMENSLKWINEKSDFMRLRSKTFNRELREISQRVHGKSKFMQVADASLFFVMQKMQSVADVPTWIGQYEKSLAAGLDDAAAVQQADEAVLGSQGGGTTKDLAGVQRNMPFLTQFYSYFNTTLNLVAEKTALTDFKRPAAVAGWLGDMVLLTVIPAILPAMITYLLKGGGEDDEPEDWAKRMLEWQAGYMLGMFVGLRELPALWSPFDYAGPPAGKLMGDGKRLVQQAGQGEIDDPAVLATIGFLGTALGLPTIQVVRSYKGWQAWADGDAPPTSILFGPPPKN